jgi:hypothetical protein
LLQRPRTSLSRRSTCTSVQVYNIVTLVNLTRSIWRCISSKLHRFTLLSKLASPTDFKKILPHNFLIFIFQSLMNWDKGSNFAHPTSVFPCLHRVHLLNKANIKVCYSQCKTAQAAYRLVRPRTVEGNS